MLFVALGWIALAQADSGPAKSKDAPAKASPAKVERTRIQTPDARHTVEIPKVARRRLQGDLLAIHLPEFGEELVRVSSVPRMKAMSPDSLVREAAKVKNEKVRGEGKAIWFHRVGPRSGKGRLHLWMRALDWGSALGTLRIPDDMPEADRQRVIDVVVPELLATMKPEKSAADTKAPILREGGEDPEILAVKEDDPQMAACVAEAKATLGEAWRVIDGKDKGEPPAFKVHFAEDGQVEFMWINEIRRKGDAIEGRLQNAPNFLKKVKEGQRVTIKPDDIVDWMYFSEEGVVGGYSVRLLARRMPRERGNEVLKQLGLKPIED